MSLLPANATARRREEELRERARTETLDRFASIERKLDGVIMGLGAASAASDPAIRTLALAIGSDRVLLPTAVTISRRLTEDDGEIAVALQVGHLTFTIEEAVRLGVLDLSGLFDHYRFTALLHAVPQSGWVHPLHDAARPATRPRL